MSASDGTGKPTSILRGALSDVDITGRVRIDEATGKASVLDVLRIVLRCASSGTATTYLSRIFEVDDCTTSIRSRVVYTRINGSGRETPVTDLKTLVEIIWKLPGQTSAKFRRKSAQTICRVLGGDLDLVRQIEQNNRAWKSIEGGSVIQQALIEPTEYLEQERANRVKESAIRDDLLSVVGGEKEVETPSGFIDILSASEVIEVKYYKQWKAGFGQVLAYQTYYPRLAKRLHLFSHIGDRDTLKYFALATSVCEPHGVKVTFEGVVGTVCSADKTGAGGERDMSHDEKRIRTDVVQ